jgi:5'-3' exonuclease
MGIFQFYSWFRKSFTKDIYKLQKNINIELDIEIDNLLIDMNGLFHTSAQKIYKYGSYKPSYDILIKENNKNNQLVFQDICEKIEELLIVVNPAKKLILCVDGVCVFAKINQQRKRRYKSAIEREENDKSFDSNNITPGTQFMDHLSKYIDWFIRKRISENPLWQNIEIIYSSCSVPSEGEQKILSWIRKFGNRNETFCIHALDADLIMLSLLTHFPKFYVLRDDYYDKSNKYLLLNIGSVREQLIEMMRWEKDKEIENDFHFDKECVINDFVFLMYFCGNDFLPNIPSLEIIEGGVDVIIQISKNVGRTHGHITRKRSGNIIFCKTSLKQFLSIISDMEKDLLEQKYKNRSRYFPDAILDKSASYNVELEKYEIDIEKFREIYNETRFNNEQELKNACMMYLSGMQWILRYYTRDVPSWKWFYPFHYGPSATTLIKYIDEFEFPRFIRGVPLNPLQQLLCVLPIKSSKLLPTPLDTLLSTKLKKYNPDDVEIDLSGKSQEYMGIVKLPFMDISEMKKSYEELIEKVDERELKRNNIGKTLLYKYNPTFLRVFNSYYGNIKECKVEIKVIDLS